MHDLKVEVVRRFAELECRRGEWNALVKRAQTSTIFQTYEWHASWWRVFGGNAQLLVLLVYRGAELVVIAPLMSSSRRILGRTQRVIEFIGTRMSDYCDFIVAADDVRSVACVLDQLEELGFDVLHLRDLPESSLTRSLLAHHFDAAGRAVDVRALYEAPSRHFGDRAADIRLPQKKSLRRHYNHFSRSGRLEFKARIAREDVPRYLDLLIAQHVARWARTDTPSLFTDERMRAFFSEIARALEETDWLLFSAVLHEGRAIALHFGFEYGNRIIWYKPSFDVDLARHSPGEVLIKFLLEYALERGVQQLDFTIGEDAFKYRFANRAPLNYAVRVFRHGIDHALTRFFLAAKDRVERLPLLARLGRRMIGRWRDHLWM